VGGLSLARFTTGCFPGMPADFEEQDNWNVRLPRSPANRALYFGDGVNIEYHVDINVFSTDMAHHLGNSVEAMLTLIDAELLAHESQSFAPGEPIDTVEERLSDIIESEWEEMGGHSADLHTLSLIVDLYNIEDDWAGGEAE